MERTLENKRLQISSALRFRCISTKSINCNRLFGIQFCKRFQTYIFIHYYGIKHEYGFLFQMKRLSLCRWLLLHFLHHLVVCEFDFIDVLKNEFILTNFKYHPRMLHSDFFNENH